MNAGETTGHYRIVRPLGHGGMGEVYLAEDTRLKREVAIKVLPDRLRHDPDRLSRFRREAQAAARLKHPSIATIHALEEFDDDLLITMEYVEGRPLKSLIPSNGMELSTFFDTFIPLADALVHAHGQNRVHRDLKPDNIMMTADGTPKILDFGLARIIDPDPSSSGNARAARDAEDTSSDALTRMDERESAVSAREGVPSLTRGGQLIGTPQYMSPEQAEGEPMDARTDLFSVGVVMYEALTGRRPFEGKTLESIIGRIIEVEPAPVAALKPSTPYALGWLIRRCLRKKRDDRIQSARELLADLREIREEVESGKALVELGSVSQAEPNRRGGRPSLPWVVGALMLAGVAGLASRLSAPEPERAVRRFVLPATRLPTGIGAEVSGPSVSPDGKKVAYIDEDSLWIRDLDQVEPRPIAGTVGAYSPFWSSDSATVGYAKGASAAVTFQGNTLWKVSVDGSSNVKICDLEGILSRGTWGRGGEIAFDTYSDRKRLFTVSERGGTPQLLLESPVPGRSPRIDYLHAFYLPDSNALLGRSH